MIDESQIMIIYDFYFDHIEKIRFFNKNKNHFVL